MTMPYNERQGVTHSFMEIGQHLGVSQQQAHRIHKQLMVKLRDKFCEDEYIRSWLIDNGFPVVESTHDICGKTAWKKMREVDRMRLLVVDAVDSMSRMSDTLMTDASRGIQEHMEEVFLGAEEEEVEDVVAASLSVALSILIPCFEQMKAQTSDRQQRARQKGKNMCYDATLGD